MSQAHTYFNEWNRRIGALFFIRKTTEFFKNQKGSRDPPDTLYAYRIS